MINLIKQFVSNNSLLFSASVIKKVSMLQLASSSWRNFDYGRLVYLIFIHDQPKAVAKLYHTSKNNDSLAKEFDVLKYLQSQNADYCPKPITLTKIGEYNVLFETFIEGYSLLSELTNIKHLSTSSIKHLSRIFRNHFNIAYYIFSKQNIQNQNGSSREETKEIKNLIKEFAIYSNAEKKLIQKIDAIINRTDFGISSKRIVHFNLATINIFKGNGSYKLTDFECSQKSYLWYIEPAMFTFHYIGNLIELGFVKNTFFETMQSFRLNPKNIFEKEAMDFCRKCFNGDSKFMQKSFILALIKSYILQKERRAFIPQEEEKIFTDIIKLWLQEVNYPSQKMSVKIITRFDSDQKGETKRLKEQISQIKNQIKTITNSRGWKIATTAHAIRMKIPILNNL